VASQKAGEALRKSMFVTGKFQLLITGAFPKRWNSLFQRRFESGNVVLETLPKLYQAGLQLLDPGM